MCLGKWENENKLDNLKSQHHFLLGVRDAVCEQSSHFILTKLYLFLDSMKKELTLNIYFIYICIYIHIIYTD